MMKKMMTILLSMAVLVTLSGCGGDGKDDHSGKAKAPSGSSIQEGRYYGSVVADFQENGFQNITAIPLGDLITGWLTKEGSVEAVQIDGNQDYQAGKWYAEDAQVVITYHSFPEAPSAVPDDEATQTPMESQPPDEVSEEPISTPMAEPSDEPSLEPSPESTAESDAYSDSKHRSTAKRAFQNYGDMMYPYGVDYHWLMGAHKAEYEGGGVWYFKVEITITNALGVERDAVAEGRVDFINETVKDFSVADTWD